MKKLLFLILFITGITNAQIVNIPDANFKAKLLEADVINSIAKDSNGNYYKIDANNDGEIQKSEALSVAFLSVPSSGISNLTGIEGFKNLTFLNCLENKLTSLNLTPLVKLEILNCWDNQLNSLDVTSLVNLIFLSCGSNQLTSLDVTPLVNLTEINCVDNQLTSLDVTPLINLMYLNCRSNQLKTLFIKNSINEKLTIADNPNLEYICADEFQLEDVQSELDYAGMINTVVNSYCSFNPGGDYNTISGNVRFDSDANGCDVNDLAFSNLKININDGINSGSTFENQLGDYKFYVQETNITLTPSFENPSYFNVSPTTVALNTLAVNGITQTQDFCVTANEIHNDLEIVIVPIGIARPGFDSKYKIIYKNKGNQELSGDINLNFDDAILDYVSATINPDSQSTNSLMWNYTNLQPFESRNFTVTLNLNSPQEIPAVNDGEVLDLSVSINPIFGDEMPLDNVFDLHQIVVNSLDPNNITCLEGNTVSPNKIGEYLYYNINFENIGTASAVNIVVKDNIDSAKFDVSSLQVLNASHEMNTKITDNKVEFIFESINLEAKQQGNVTFKIKTKNTLQTGDSVLNNADIFFDYNFPIATNDEVTTFQALSNATFTIDNSISIYPNPTNDFINIAANGLIKSIQMYDLQGRIIKISSINEKQSKFDISYIANGIYFLKVQTGKGSIIKKIIKK